MGNIVEEFIVYLRILWSLACPKCW